MSQEVKSRWKTDLGGSVVGGAAVVVVVVYGSNCRLLRTGDPGLLVA